ncbi:MAG: hypothetical protein BGO72_06765 [Burkholderiales bacterium 70-64]|nr:MAG: hypothetical protein BGO72_06765 [Burkholderiales bacterium 70-64]
MSTILRRIVPFLVGVLSMSAATAALAQADPSWPSRPIRVVTPFPTGGINDVIARIVAEHIAPRLGQPIVVEPRTGAGGNIGTDAVAKSAPDGYTWLASSFPVMSLAPALYASLPFDPVADFRAVAMTASAPNLLVVSSQLPVSTVAELAAYARTKPQGLTYASPGNGSSAHLGSELLKRSAGFEAQQIVYRGAPPALVDVMGGVVDFMLASVSLAAPQIKAGKLKALAVMDTQRSPLAPDVPTLSEAGYREEPIVPWFAIHVPAGTPAAIVQRVNREVERALKDPDVRERLEKAGAKAAAPASPEAVDARVRDEVRKLGQFAREIHLPKQ